MVNKDEQIVMTIRILDLLLDLRILDLRIDLYLCG